MLVLIRAFEGDGFGRMAAIRALLRDFRGQMTASQNEEFEKIRCKRIEKLRGRARSALNKREARVKVFRVVLVSQR